MIAEVHNLTVEQGASYEQIIRWTDADGVPINLTGATAAMQVRQATNVSTVLFEASTANGKLAIAATDGQITLTITAAESAAFTWSFGKYDLEVTTAGGLVYRLLRGTISISAEVTQ
jgi:hypothetical protein